MRRRGFVGAVGVAIFAPKFGSWYRRGSGLVVPTHDYSTPGPGSRIYRIVKIGDGTMTLGSSCGGCDVVVEKSLMATMRGHDFRLGDSVRVSFS